MMEALDVSSDTPGKHAACLECRKSKTRCIRLKSNSSCRKCEKSGTPCVVPEYHVGRYKGVKNKQSGLDKAISQVEKAIKKSRNGSRGIDKEQTRALKQLLCQTNDTPDAVQSLRDSMHDPEHDFLLSPAQPHSSQPSSTSHTSVPSDKVDNTGEVTVDNADNPLQLLAIASAIPERISPATSQPPMQSGSGEPCDTVAQATARLKFFQPIRSQLDVSRELDPICLGLATEEDARRSFKYFYQHLAPTRWGMDPVLHTHTFVRSRSMFLLTSVMAASALFLPNTAALSLRLRNHIKKLIPIIVSNRYRSVEIVLAFMINIPWMSGGEEWASEDDTCYYLSLALTIALDLSLQRIVVPVVAPRPSEFLDRTAKADCIDERKALTIDRFENVNPSSEVVKRLLRTRERTWLALFNLDRGVCLARGRPPTVPASALVQSCDTWHIFEFADAQDSALISATVLRREFVDLVDGIRATCDNNLLSVGEDSSTIRYLRDKIETFFEQWYETWSSQMQQSDGCIPPYVEILASHTKLSAYCNVINHPTAPIDVKKFFRAAGLASALYVLKVAVFAETKLPSMPNNTVIMVSFAALFVLGLRNYEADSGPLVTANTINVLEELARVLQRLGCNPTHRQGASFWFGKHIQAIVERVVNTPPLQPQLQQEPNGHHQSQEVLQLVPGIQSAADSDEALMNAFDAHAFESDIENLQIPDMTNDQIIDIINGFSENVDIPSSEFLSEQDDFLNWLQI